MAAGSERDVAKAYIGLGANLGNREGNIRGALAMLVDLEVGRVPRVSRLVEFEPVGGPPGQPKYLNGAALVETELSPFDLLEALKIVESEVGRIERERWAAREIDLDILLYDDLVLDIPLLVIPHPRMCEREFVLRPLSEIAPDVVHPVAGKTIREIYADLRAGRRPT